MILPSRYMYLYISAALIRPSSPAIPRRRQVLEILLNPELESHIVSSLLSCSVTRESPLTSHPVGCYRFLRLTSTYSVRCKPCFFDLILRRNRFLNWVRASSAASALPREHPFPPMYNSPRPGLSNQLQICRADRRPSNTCGAAL